MAPLALVTREKPGRSGPALAALGYDVLAEPMLRIVLRENVALPLGGLQGYAVTSANGARALALAGAPLDLPLWAVGDATAAAARSLGFIRVASADGDVARLAGLIGERLRPEDGALLYVHAGEPAADLAAMLAPKRFSVRMLALYDAEPVSDFTKALKDALEAGRIAVALFFSPRAARRFVTLARTNGVAASLRPVGAYALSGAVAAELAGLDWAGLGHPDRPRLDALLALIPPAQT